jgi:hypothetical protein
MTVSAPYRDPYSQKRTVDWLVVERTTAGAAVHRLTRREDADAWLRELPNTPSSTPTTTS